MWSLELNEDENKYIKLKKMEVCKEVLSHGIRRSDNKIDVKNDDVRK